MPSGTLRRRSDNWYLDIHSGRKIDGKKERIRRRATGRTRKEAQVELDEELYRLRRSGVLGEALDNNYLFEDLVKLWKQSITHTVMNAKTAREYCGHIDRISAKLKIEFVRDITRAEIEKAMADIAENLSTNTANKSLDKLKAALDYGIDTGLIKSNPAKRIKHLRLIRKKFRRDLSHDEAAALLREATETYRPLWFAYLCTGAREAELVNLRSEDVNLKKRHIRIRASEGRSIKTDAGHRTIPINEELCEVLKAIMPENGFVFGTRDGRPRKNNLLRAFRVHMKKALLSLGHSERETTEELKRLDIHSLRYTFITELIDSGGNPKVVQQLAGHKDITTTLGVYAQCRQGSIDSAIDHLPWSLKSCVTNTSQKANSSQTKTIKKPVSR